jgi:hypothetical protein
VIGGWEGLGFVRGSGIGDKRGAVEVQFVGMYVTIAAALVNLIAE